ncbi:hypothetical protein LO80_09040 [Candidatus Francisella endociliophora]|uniref:Lipoprotein n=1 Tax=Candidatus Francisella endociliophora TaxID=653937 RepID=A0A097ERA3_9GAMM|nr:hypothetical protein [Francisella sp. FSC1006]AIT10103.1 hypothetical protein LO80_09040 [Francisella sp. FSC1006]
MKKTSLIIATTITLGSCSCSYFNDSLTKNHIQKPKSSIVYQVTPEKPDISPNAISPLSNRNVGNIQGIADYLSSAFLTRHKDENSEDGYLTAYQITYVTNTPKSFGTYIRCNHDEQGIYHCNPRDTYTCKEQICKGKDDYSQCMKNCPAIGSSDQIGAGWINKDLDDPVMYFSLPQQAECSENQHIGNDNCTWKVTKDLGSIGLKEILDKGLILKPKTKESSDEKQLRVEKNTEILKEILKSHNIN